MHSGQEPSRRDGIRTAIPFRNRSRRRRRIRTGALQRQGHRNPQSGRLTVACHNLPLRLSNQFCNDRQAQTKPTGGPRTGLVQAPERLEQMLEMLWRNTWALIGHAELNTATGPVPGTLAIHGQHRAVRCVAKRVAQQIFGQHGDLELRQGHLKMVELLRQNTIDPNVSLCRFELKGLQRYTQDREQLAGCHRRATFRQRPHAGELKQLANEVVDVFDVRHDPLASGTVRGIFSKQFRSHLHARQRRSNLVRYIPQQLALLAERIKGLLKRTLEAAGETSNLITAMAELSIEINPKITGRKLFTGSPSAFTGRITDRASHQAHSAENSADSTSSMEGLSSPSIAAVCSRCAFGNAKR